MKDNTKRMLESISIFGSENCRATAKDIVNGKKTVENEMKCCGSFMRAVYDGDFLAAFDHADRENKNALKNMLL